MIMEKFCANCAYYIPPKRVMFFFKLPEHLAMCGHPEMVSKFDGKPDTFCKVERFSDAGATCGAAGKLFKEKS